MTNAATRLAQKLEDWHVPGNQHPSSIRGFADEDDVKAWRAHAAVQHWVTLVDQTLSGMRADGDDVSLFEPHLPSWYAAVNWVRTPWGSAQGGARHSCDPHSIALLRALGLLIDAADPLDLTEDERRSLSDILKTAREMLEEDAGTLPKDVRRYVWGLIIRAQAIVDDYETFGTETVREVALELAGVMQAQGERAEQHGDPERAGRWKSLVVQLLVGFFSGASGGSAQALTEGFIKQLGN